LKIICENDIYQKKENEMKKILLLSLILISVHSFSQVKENPFNSIMGMKWGINVAEFKKSFQYPLQVFAYKNELFFENFELGDLTIDTVTFVFNSKVRGLEFSEANFERFFLSSAYMDIVPDQFDSLLDIFKTKYGSPLNIKNSTLQNRMGAKFAQTEVMWENGNRFILLDRYSNNLEKGLCLFTSVTKINDDLKEGKLRNREAADKL
jgi:hypothetical protein